MRGIAADGALVDTKPPGKIGDGAGPAALQDFQQGEHPGGRSRHTGKSATDTGQPLPGIRRLGPLDRRLRARIGVGMSGQPRLPRRG